MPKISLLNNFYQKGCEMEFKGKIQDKNKMRRWYLFGIVIFIFPLLISAYATFIICAPIFFGQAPFIESLINSSFSHVAIFIALLICLYIWFRADSDNNKLNVLMFFITLMFTSISAGPSIYKLLRADISQNPIINKNTIVFDNGETSLSTAIKLDILLFSNKEKLITAKMSGPGGDTLSANYIKYRLQKAGIIETVAYGDECNSSCTILWTAGKVRRIQDDLNLGFHRTCDLLDYCSINAHLYYGFLNPELINILANPGSDHVCPLNNTDVTILEGKKGNEKQCLIEEVKKICLVNGISSTLIKDFPGYKRLKRCD